jgi:iron complex outermembrane receptor protein
MAFQRQLIATAVSPPWPPGPFRVGPEHDHRRCHDQRSRCPTAATAQPALQPIVVTATPFASQEDVQVLTPPR